VDNPLYNPITQNCNKDSDCFDENFCTIDTCINATSLCSNELVSWSCDSILQSIRENLTPFVYHTFIIHQTERLHNSFSAFMLKEGTLSSVSYHDDGPFQRVSLNFVFNYFGNLVSAVYISPNGVIFLPPMQKYTQYLTYTVLCSY